MKGSLVLGCGILSLVQTTAGEQSPESVTLKITEDPGGYTLTVPVSQLVMTIPKGELQIQRDVAGGGANHPRYFYLAHQADPYLQISGWFESADGFTDIESFWRDESGAFKKQGLPKPRHVSFEHIGTWNAVLYDMVRTDPVLVRTVITSAHMRAHWIQSGTWIDVHLSLTGHGPASAFRSQLREILQSITVVEKSPS